MKIKKYASGGVYTPFDPPIKTPATDKKSTGKSGSSKSPDLPFKKELIELINSKGLPSDTAVFFNELSQILYRYQFDDSIDAPAYMATLFAKKASDMEGEQDAWNNANNEVVRRGVSDDIATSGRYMYVMDKTSEDREMTLISPEEYLKDREKWTVLTNKEILHARKFDPNFAFSNSTIIADTADATNLKLLREYWKTETKALATQSNSGVLGQTTVHQDYVTGAKLIQQQGGEVDSSTTLRNEHVQNYLSFLYSSMNQKQQGYLASYLAVEQGLAPTGENILTFMFNNIIDYVGTSSKYSPETKKKGSGGGSGSGGGGNDINGTTTDNQAIRVQQFDGPRQRVVIKAKPSAPGAKQGAFETYGISYGRFTDKEHDPITGPISLTELLGQSQALLAGNVGSMYIGNKKLDESNSNYIYWNNSQLESVLLPPLRQTDGTVRPWFELMEHLAHINTGTWSKLDVDNYLLKHGLKDAVKFNGTSGKYEFNIDNTIPFIVFKAFCSEKLMKLSDSDKLFFEKVSKNIGDPIAKTINKWYDYSTFQNDNEWDNIFAGNVYIPLNTDWATFSSSADQYVPKSLFYDVNRNQQANSIHDSLVTDPNKKEITTNFNQ